MESDERGQSATDVEQDLGAPGGSVEAADTATDVEQDVGDSGETAATDPTLR
jgi:hypothetical protein